MVIRSLAFLLATATTLPDTSYAMERAQFETLARQCAPGVHPDTLMAVIQTESSFNPFAININGDQQLPRQPTDAAEAIATATYLSENSYNFDAGLGQINSTNVSAFGMTWPDVFEPCANLNAAAHVLTDCFVRASSREPDPQIALRQALSCYNTGSFTRGHQNGYVARVERSADLPPIDVVPALAPLAPVLATVEAPQSQLATNDVPPDAFGRRRLDAFSRASTRARMEHELHANRPTNAFRLTIEPSSNQQ